MQCECMSEFLSKSKGCINNNSSKTNIDKKKSAVNWFVGVANSGAVDSTFKP